MTLSRNATLISKISISVPEFIDVSETKGFVEFRGSLAHGWMAEDRIVKDAFLREKYLFLRFGGSELPARFIFGLTHFNNWAGTHIDPEIGKLTVELQQFSPRVFWKTGGFKRSG